jgi:hypothetical protein
MIDLYTLYRKHPAESRRPFNRFFETSAFTAVFEYLRYEQKLPETAILKRTHGQKQAPATALAHPLVALEFIRWLDYPRFMAMLLTFAEPPTKEEAMS